MKNKWLAILASYIQHDMPFHVDDGEEGNPLFPYEPLLVSGAQAGKRNVFPGINLVVGAPRQPDPEWQIEIPEE
jgi:hypothetical protein